MSDKELKQHLLKLSSSIIDIKYQGLIKIFGMCYATKENQELLILNGGVEILLKLLNDDTYDILSTSIILLTNLTFRFPLVREMIYSSEQVNKIKELASLDNCLISGECKIILNNCKII